MYKERNEEYHLISNRLRILNPDINDFPEMNRFKSREVQNYSKTFDPIRMKLRILPQERVTHYQLG